MASKIKFHIKNDLPVSPSTARFLRFEPESKKADSFLLVVNYIDFI